MCSRSGFTPPCADPSQGSNWGSRGVPWVTRPWPWRPRSATWSRGCKGGNFFFCFYLFIGELALPCCVWTFSGCGTRASHCSGFSCYGARALDHVGCSSCGAWTQLLWGTWDLPGPGSKPMFPVLVGRFLTTGPPGKCCERDNVYTTNTESTGASSSLGNGSGRRHF